METKMMISAVISGAVLIVGALEMIYQIYHITVIDATARGLKHPKFWGIFAMSGNNSGGLLMYLIGRNKYPVINLPDSEKQKMEKRKKCAGVGLIFLALGTIGLIIGNVYL